MNLDAFPEELDACAAAVRENMDARNLSGLVIKHAGKNQLSGRP